MLIPVDLHIFVVPPNKLHTMSINHPLYIFALSLFTIAPLTMVAQEKYEVAVTRMATEINTQLGLTSTATVLVSSFKRMDGKGCELDEMITTDLEAALIRKAHSYKLLDRSDLSVIAEEHKLQMSGMMDEEQQMREAGKLLKADAIIFGSYSLAGSTLLLRLKAVDVQTSEQLAIAVAACMPSAVITSWCKEPPPHSSVTRDSQIPNKEPATATVAPPPCNSTVGSYCFMNNSNTDILVSIPAFNKGYSGFQYSRTLTGMTVPSGKKECFYDKEAGVYDYVIYTKGNTSTSHTNKVREASIRIESCKTGTYSYP